MHSLLSSKPLSHFPPPTATSESITLTDIGGANEARAHVGILNTDED